jgi:hypothetical protein
MSARTLAAFSTIRTEGAMLPSDILVRVASGDKSLGGLEESSYHLAPGEKIGEATNRAWNRLQAAWANFQSAREKLAGTDTGTSLTRERWLLPLFQLLDYGRLQAAKAEEISGKSYPISHAWQQTPIHLVGCNVDLDRRIQTAAGGMRSSPHSLLQELLNRSDQHLWGIVSNGLCLRLLRDNISLTRQAYVEFDLEAMMVGEAYPDFVLLWLLLHQSRFEAERPEQCQLEKWSQAARTEGVRVLDGLRDGVQRAIEHLGQGFLAHPANTVLRENLRSGALDKQDYYRQILRLVYRLLFLFVADDRDLLLALTADPAAQKRYRDFYATTRLRRLATTRAGSRHHDLYCGLKLVMEKLSGDGCPELALPALGSFLFSPRALPDLNACDISNLHLLEAIRSLAVTQTGQSRRVVDYKNLGSEELGSVYESLLELHPDLNAEAASFELKVAAGSERKKTGSYYTPTSLISCLLDSALDPVLLEAAKQPEPEAAILKLKVVDPACGSGHFLIAAAHRIAKRLAAVRTGEEEPPPEAQRKAIRDVIGHCIYGVDVNPMAVELCKVSLWMEALEPGKPLSFLEHRIQPGNSLLGATPALLAQGIPDEAFTPIEGDDKEICKEFKRINKDERNKQMRLFAATTEPWLQLGNFAASLMNLDTVGDDSIEAVREKERMYEAAIRSGDYLDGRFWADTWCAAFVWKKTREFTYPITEEVFRRIERNPHGCEVWTRKEIERLANQYHFFHWHLAFPDVFRLLPNGTDPEAGKTGWNGGFDVVLGNPPWESAELIEKEFFAVSAPEIANERTKARRAAKILVLRDSNPTLFLAWESALRAQQGSSHFIKNSGLYPDGSGGKLNTYRLFAEISTALLSPYARLGLVLKSGIVSAQDSQTYFAKLLRNGRVASVFEFINTKLIFPAVVANERFCLFSIAGSRPSVLRPVYAFGLTAVEQTLDPAFRITLTIEDLQILNPNDSSIPPLTSERDKNILLQLHRAFTSLVRESPPANNPWHARYIQGHLNSASGSHLFAENTLEQLLEQGGRMESNGQFCLGSARLLPLYEGKFIGQMNCRFGTFEGVPIANRFGVKAEAASPTAEQLDDPDYGIAPRYWLSEGAAEELFRSKKTNFPWLFAFRDVCRSIVDARTIQACVVPRIPCLDSCPIIAFELPHEEQARASIVLNVLWSSFLLDYVARQKIHGAHLTKAIAYQLPMLTPRDLEYHFCGQTRWSFIYPRALELTFVCWDLSGLAKAVGWEGPPFRWNGERRFLLRSELDAYCLHVFGVSRTDAGYILDTFPIVRRKEESAHGEYRAKRVILEIYDAMAEAERSGSPYQTRLDPPPADPRVAHQPHTTDATAKEP